MRVDHARHQRAAPAIDHIRIGDRLGRSHKRLDALAFDQNALALDQRRVGAVEDRNIPEEDRLLAALRMRRVD
ncbi:hypothetical protein, partial [Sphingomonas sp.]|uniref:hypothetical protein n=1 Tax=Sphingomonas sp. TaxID=28214 RepID=UPI003B3AAFAF